jgi:hypothetical protein
MAKPFQLVSEVSTFLGERWLGRSVSGSFSKRGEFFGAESAAGYQPRATPWVSLLFRTRVQKGREEADGASLLEETIGYMVHKGEHDWLGYLWDKEACLPPLQGGRGLLATTPRALPWAAFPRRFQRGGGGCPVQTCGRSG